MPAIREKTSVYKQTTKTRKGGKHVENDDTPINGLESSGGTLRSISDYPLDPSARSTFRTRDGKKLTEFQWAVYDFARTIPSGRVTTYSAISKAIGRGSPRSVGFALRNNPFAPLVPCHRVIASNFFIGGFFGEWGVLSSGKKGSTLGKQCQRKKEMLVEEGVGFTADGYIADKGLIWG